MGLRNSSCRWSTLLALAAVSLTLPALAGDDPPAAAPPEQAAAQTAAAVAQPVAAVGLVAYIDPATGGLTSAPTEEQRAALRSALAALVNESDAGLLEVALPDGTIVMDLQGRFQEAVVVQLAPDGTRRYDCVSSVASATDTPPVAAAPATPVAAAE